MTRQLSQRQREVLVLLAKGMSYKVIGKHLGIAPSSVKTHVSMAYAVLGVYNRTEASVLITQRPELVAA